jgi:ABC-type uncharacterized transport system YnjBCD permease subunit
VPPTLAKTTQGWAPHLEQCKQTKAAQMASFLLTLVTTIVIQIAWPRLTETNSQ